MNWKSQMAAGMAVVVAMAMVCTIIAAAQTNTFTIGNFTLSVPNTNPAVTIQTPGRSGVLALRDELPTGPITQQPVAQRGLITLANGQGNAPLSGFTVAPVCVVSDPSGNSVKYTVAASRLDVSGVGPTVYYICQ